MKNPITDPECMCSRAHVHMPGLLCGSQTTFLSTVYFRDQKNKQKNKKTENKKTSLGGRMRGKKGEMDFIKIGFYLVLCL